MAADDNDDLDPDQKSRIEKLKQEADRLTGGKMRSMESEDISPDISEAFWKHIVEFESAPWISNFQRLLDAGVEMPAPDEMDDETLKAKLWEVIEKLARLRVFITSTDHLSDRELYSYLWNDSLREESPRPDLDEYSAWHLDLVSSGSEEHIYLWMKYYADEETRKQWKADWPDYEMPPHEDPPYNRDEFLPEAQYGVIDDGDPELPM
ncbi:MAG TPA: hypothetical protein VFC63_04810 [Blastocatellia bacterium]|nr:hypothetical protein [Blastocatellia bacterium]